MYHEKAELAATRPPTCEVTLSPVPQLSFCSYSWIILIKVQYFADYDCGQNENLINRKDIRFLDLKNYLDFDYNLKQSELKN